MVAAAPQPPDRLHRRLLNSIRPTVAPGVIVSIAVSAAVFAATPFLIPAVASDQHIEVGRVGLISTTQLLGFVLASWGVPRLMHPRRRLMVAAALLGVASNLLSAGATSFDVLLVTRLLSGVSLGLIEWIVWAQAFGDDDRIGDVAVIAPIVGTIASPVLALLIDGSGPRAGFVALAVLNLAPLLFIRTTELIVVDRPVSQRHRPTRSSAAILVSLLLLTFGGSGMFIFCGSIGIHMDGLSPLVVSLVFAANGLAGIPGARSRRQRSHPGAWLVAIALSATVVVLWHQPIPFIVGMMLWGFFYWTAVPAVYSLLARRSRYPDERAGDAQAVMAVGRVIGPLIGGALFDFSLVALTVVAGGAIVVGGVILMYVEWRVRPAGSHQTVSPQAVPV